MIHALHCASVYNCGFGEAGAKAMAHMLSTNRVLRDLEYVVQRSHEGTGCQHA